MCRYIHVIMPREEGKAAVDNSPKKIKKTKTLALPPPAKTSGSRPMRTSQLFTCDNNTSFTSVWHHKFETLKSIFQKKAPTNRSMLASCAGGSAGNASNSTANRHATNAKHALVLQEAGIAYDAPLNPVQVAAVRAERIVQKQKAAAALAEVQSQQQQQQRLANLSSAATGGALPPNSPLTTRVAAVAGTGAVGNNASLAPNSPLTARVSTAASPSTVGGVSAVNAVSAQPSSLLSTAASGQVRTQVVAASSPARSVHGQAPVAGQLTGQPVAVTVANVVHVQTGSSLAATAAGLPLTTTTMTTSVVKGASVTLVQTGGTTVVSPATAATKTLTPNQLQYLRQQALAKQQQQRLEQQQQQLKKLGGVGGGGTVVSSVAAAGSQLAVTSPGAKQQPGGGVTVAGGLAGTTLATLGVGQSGQIVQTAAGRATQLLKGNALLGKGGTVARAIVTDTEMAALIKRQQQYQQQQKAVQQQQAGGGTVVASGSSTITTAQFLAQAGLQVKKKIKSNFSFSSKILILTLF